MFTFYVYIKGLHLGFTFTVYIFFLHIRFKNYTDCSVTGNPVLVDPATFFRSGSRQIITGFG